MEKNIKKTHIMLISAAAAVLLCACGASEMTITPMAESTPVFSTPEAEQTPTISLAGMAEISEVMSKNKATVMADDGTFPDWVEIVNLSGGTLDLENWQISDSPEGGGMLLKGSVESSAYAAFFTSGFGLSKGETVYLIDPYGNVVDSLEISEEDADISLTKEGSTKYPTPGRENTKEAFADLQSQKTASGPLVVNEVAVENFEYYRTTDEIEYTDWVEIKNISSESVKLSSYCISDDSEDLQKYTMPDLELAPGDTIVILCDKAADTYKGTYYMAPFSLNSENDRLFLSTSDGNIIDFTALKDIPYAKTYGRVEGENGFFYLESPTPDTANGGGKRFVAETPVSLTADGVYEDVESVTVELQGEGKIYYTLDGQVPDETSNEYEGPFEVDKTTIVRAVSCCEGAENSRPLTLSFIINEGHTLPVVSVVSDNKASFNFAFDNGYKLGEMPGVISYYGDDGTFTIGAGIKLHGDTSLLLPKKNLSFRFRGCYGADELDFDLYGGGITTFTNLLLRAGQEQMNTIVRGEACTNILASCTDSVIYQRSKYCVVYVNGEYNGIYSLKEKINEQLYADLYDVSKDSVDMCEAIMYTDNIFYREVVTPIYSGDMSNDEEFLEATKQIDLQSLIDWTLIEGWTGNYDLMSGNLKYVRSSENDGKWRLCFYDLDCAFSNPTYIMGFEIDYINQISGINYELIKNAGYRARLLERAGELYGNEVSDERIVEEIRKLAKEVEPEVERDAEVSGLGLENFNKYLERLIQTIEDNDWTQHTIDVLCEKLNVTPEEKEQYFN